VLTGGVLVVPILVLALVAKFEEICFRRSPAIGAPWEIFRLGVDSVAH
jgi:hypothetical protein